MRRRNIFPDPTSTGILKAVANAGTALDYAQSDGKRWGRATTTDIGNNQNYGQYSLTGSKIPPAGAYRVGLLVHAEGGDGMARGYVRNNDGTYTPYGSVTIPEGRTVDVLYTCKVPEECLEMLIRICPAGVKGATMMMTNVTIESAETHDLASGGGFQASSPQAPRHTDLEAGDRR